MVFTNIGQSGTALLWAGSGDPPRYCSLGSGSGAVAVTNGSLVAEVFSSRKDFTTRDQSVSKNMTWTWDFGSVSMSGVQLKEFGVSPGSVIDVVNLYSRDGFPNIEFNGENELQIEVTFTTY